VYFFYFWEIYGVLKRSAKMYQNAGAKFLIYLIFNNETKDLKSCVHGGRAGSSPVPGTKQNEKQSESEDTNFVSVFVPVSDL
jgi:hypothetical protein